MLLSLLLACGPDVDAPAPLDEGSAAAKAASWTPCVVDVPCRIMPLGDSITDGYNVPGGYRIRLERLMVDAGVDYDFVGSLANGPATLVDQNHEGHPSWRTDQIQWILSDRLATYDPDVVLVHIGTNDIYGSDPHGAPGRLDAIIGSILGADADRVVIVAAIVPIAWSSGDLVADWYNGEVEEIAARYAAEGYPVHFVDMHSALSKRDLADGVHPTARGYAKMADAWWGALEPLVP